MLSDFVSDLYVEVFNFNSWFFFIKILNFLKFKSRDVSESVWLLKREALKNERKAEMTKIKKIWLWKILPKLEISIS